MFWKRPAKKNRVLGIDISGGYVRIAELLKKETAYSLENYLIEEMPNSPDVKSKTEALSKALASAYAKFPKQDCEVYSVVSGPDIIIRRIQIPKMEAGDLEDAIKWETKSHIPLPIESVVIDYHIIGEIQDKGAQKMDIWAVAAKKEMIERTASIFENAGIRLNGITVVPFAVWNLLKFSKELKEGEIVALINMGAETTTISFFINRDLEFFREVSIAGNNITSAMVGLFVADNWQINMNYDQAEKVKKQYGIPKEGTEEKTSDGIPLSQVLQIMKPVLRRFLNEITRSFDYYKEQYHRDKIDRIILTGGSSKLKGLSEFLTSGTCLNVGILDIFSFLETHDELKKREGINDDISHFPICLGTALSEAQQINLLGRKKETISLRLPPEIDKYVPKFLKTAPKKKPAVAAGLILLVFLVIVSVYDTAINKSIGLCKRQLNEKQVLLTDLKSLSERQAILSKIEKEQTPVRKVITELSNILPEDTVLDSFSFNNSVKAVSISGSAKTTDDVAALIKNIESSPIFSSTILSEAKKTEAKGSISFKIVFRADI